MSHARWPIARLGRCLAPVVLAVALVACGGGGGGAAVGVPGGDPVTTVNSLIATVQAKAFDKLPDLACAASKDSLTSSFDPSAALAGSFGAAGVTGNDVLNAMSISFDNAKVGSPTVNGDTATVHLTGTIKATIDSAKFADLMKKVMAAAGQPASDVTVNAAVSAAQAALSQGTPIDNNVTLKNEGGKWLICQ